MSDMQRNEEVRGRKEKRKKKKDKKIDGKTNTRNTH